MARGKIGKYIPATASIPAIMVLGGLGAVILTKLVPGVINRIQSAVPTIQKPKA